MDETPAEKLEQTMQKVAEIRKTSDFVVCVCGSKAVHFFSKETEPEKVRQSVSGSLSFYFNKFTASDMFKPEPDNSVEVYTRN